MKINYTTVGFNMEAEDGRDILFMRSFLESIPKKSLKTLSNFMSVDLDTNCRVEDGPATDMDLEDIMDKDTKENTLWGDPVTINFIPYGKYTN